MDLFEYQAKELFAEYGVPVPKDKVANTAEEAREITTAFAAEGIPQVVVKAQVKTGGRGKAGGVKLADGPADAYEKAERIIGMDIKGHTVHRVLIAEATDIKSEYYLSFLLDRANRTFLSICSVDGGMEIEELAHTNPDAIARVPVSPLTGVDHAKALEIVQGRPHPRGGRGGRRPRRRAAVGDVHRRGRDPRRGEPARAHPGRPGARARRQGHARRQRRLPPGPRAVRRHRVDGPA